MTYRRVGARSNHRLAFVAGFASAAGLVIGGRIMTRPPVHAIGGLDVEPDVVVAVIDGDTLTMASGLTVRVLGVDTPETVHPDMDGPQPFGNEAASRTETLVGGKSVGLELDVTPADHYGRALRHVWVDGRLLSEILVVEGLGRHASMPPDDAYSDRLSAAESSARAAGRGIWSARGATPVSVFR